MSDIMIDTTTKTLVIENGDLKLTPTFGELTRQRVYITMNTFRGEWKFNILFGVPYLANENNSIQIFGKSVPKRVFDKYIRDAILSVEGISEITKFNSTLDAAERTVSGEAECLLTDGSNLSILETFNV